MPLFTSESVTAGHPDKLCDRISDAVLDEILANDRQAHVACECAINTGLVLVMGEISSTHYVDIPAIARKVIRETGYTENYAVLTSIDEQSQDINAGVGLSMEARAGSTDPLDQRGAGDQGMMFGYACLDTPEFMPLPISLAHALTRRLELVRSFLPYLGPDGKAQVTVMYGATGPVDVTTVVISAQHAEDVDPKQIERDIKEHVIYAVMPEWAHPEVLVNPSGRFVKGGPDADSGLTGRKIIVDTYGGMARHGGGAFSGKDPSKVDRSASYYARYVAKNLVAMGLAEIVEVQVSYAIGQANPISLYAEAFGTGDQRKVNAALFDYDFRPAAIIEQLGLLDMRYYPTASGGHFGRAEFPWERLSGC